MLTKGIVEKVIDDYSAKIRIPIFNKSKDAIGATPLDELSEAIICTLPNSALGLQVGDIVIVGFEDNNINKPIVLGYLSAKDITTSSADLQVNSLKVKLDTHLSEDTSIGEITPDELKALLNVKSNIQWQIDILNQKVDNIPGAIDNYIESAEVEGNTLTLTPHGGNDIIYNPEIASPVQDVKVDGTSVLNTTTHIANVGLGAGLTYNSTSGLTMSLTNVSNELNAKTMSLSTQDNTFIYAQDSNGNLGKINANNLDYSKITVTNTEVLSNIRQNDFLFLKD